MPTVLLLTDMDLEEGLVGLSFGLEHGVFVDEYPSEVRVCSENGFEYRFKGSRKEGHGWNCFPCKNLIAVKRAIDIPVGHGVYIYTFEKKVWKKSEWRPRRLCVRFQHKSQQEEFVSRVEQGIASPRRPKRILFLVNPVSGSGQTLSKYNRVIKPLFELAGVSCDMVQTCPSSDEEHVFSKKMRHCIALGATCEYDGIVAVGGDGVFFEMMNTVNRVCGESQAPCRLGHLPSGSTDAVSSTLHGTRSLFTAAMHIILGDYKKVDILHIEVDDGGDVELSTNNSMTCFCIAATGFMADVISSSSMLRFFGPFRYDIVGALKLIQNRAYKCKIRYLQCEKSFDDDDDLASQCHAECSVCSQPTSTDMSQEKNRCAWTAEIEDEFLSVMIMNQACVSDKSTHGMYKYGHLCNGEGVLVMVKKCSPWSFFRFLLAMSTHGLSQDVGDHVRMVRVSKVQVISAQDSMPLTWNLDGELQVCHTLTATPMHASLPVFARGIER